MRPDELRYIKNILYKSTRIHILLKCTWNIFQNRLYVRTSLKNLKRLTSHQAFFSIHNGIKLEINYSKKTGKFTHMRKLYNMLLSNQWVKKEVKGEIKECLEMNESENTTSQNLWNVAKGILRQKFTVGSTHRKKHETVK